MKGSGTVVVGLDLETRPKIVQRRLSRTLQHRAGIGFNSRFEKKKTFLLLFLLPFSYRLVRLRLVLFPSSMHMHV